MSASSRSLARVAPAAAALAVALACGGGEEATRASDSAYTDSLVRAAEASATPAPTAWEANADRWAVHVDSLEYRRGLRLLLARVDPESEDSWSVEGAYVGDTLVRVRGDLPGDSVGALTYYLRDGAVVLVTVAPDGPPRWVPGHVPPATPAAWYYMRADGIVRQRGSAHGVDGRLLASSLGVLRTQLAATVSDAIGSSDPVAARPVAPYVVHGACPFECCQYGRWTVVSGGVLRATQSTGAPIVGRIAPGTAVLADSGLVVVDTIGVVAVSNMMTDVDGGRTFARGDTVLLLDYQGEGARGAWLRGHLISVMEFWTGTGANGAKLLRAPHTLWWAHLTVPQRGDTLRGWFNMSADSLRVDGTDRCRG